MKHNAGGELNIRRGLTKGTGLRLDHGWQGLALTKMYVMFYWMELLYTLLSI